MDALTVVLCIVGLQAETVQSAVVKVRLMSILFLSSLMSCFLCIFRSCQPCQSATFVQLLSFGVGGTKYIFIQMPVPSCVHAYAYMYAKASTIDTNSFN